MDIRTLKFFKDHPEATAAFRKLVDRYGQSLEVAYIQAPFDTPEDVVVIRYKDAAGTLLAYINSSGETTILLEGE